MPKVKLPIDAVIAPTYKCNSRCAMCNIWQIQEPDELGLEYFKRLPKSLRYINISGGEPFLYRDLVELVKISLNVLALALVVLFSSLVAW